MSISIAARDDSDPIADMNTTPLVDVMLVLLILFIITLPVMTNSTHLHIGKGPEGPPPREAITLSIDFDGTILWNGAVVPLQGLKQLQEKEKRQHPGVLAGRPARSVSSEAGGAPACGLQSLAA